MQWQITHFSPHAWNLSETLPTWLRKHTPCLVGFDDHVMSAISDVHSTSDKNYDRHWARKRNKGKLYYKKGSGGQSKNECARMICVGYRWRRGKQGCHGGYSWYGVYSEGTQHWPIYHVLFLEDLCFGWDDDTQYWVKCTPVTANST